MKKIVFILSFSFLLQNSYAQDSIRFQFLSKIEKDLAYDFVSRKIDIFLILEKQNYAGLVKDTF